MIGCSKNHVTDYIMEDTAMPDELVRTVRGVEIFSQVQPQVWPITAFPVRVVNDASIRLVETAKRAHPLERQLNQVMICHIERGGGVDQWGDPFTYCSGEKFDFEPSKFTNVSTVMTIRKQHSSLNNNNNVQNENKPLSSELYLDITRR